VTPHPLDVDEERELASKLAGVLFLTAGLTSVVLLFLPGADDVHWRWVAGLSSLFVIWSIYCLTLAKPEEHGRSFWHAPAVFALIAIFGLIASTGGAASPARFFLFFLLVYACYFYSAEHARPYALACVAVALTPLLYDTGGGEGRYVGEMMVIGPAYVLLGGLMIQGKAQLVALRERARMLSLRDPLTELSNRRAMLEWLEARTGAGEPAGLMLIDLDGFKEVNTLHGYPAGDAVLRQTARTLEHSVRPGDEVARLGGDEFAVLVLAADQRSMESLADRVLQGMREWAADMPLEGISLTASLGWVLHPEDGTTSDELIAAADLCLRGAKLRGKDRALSPAGPALEAA
jgi:diguanylate cyclase (GGDEF)-like protein